MDRLQENDMAARTKKKKTAKKKAKATKKKAAPRRAAARKSAKRKAAPARKAAKKTTRKKSVAKKAVKKSVKRTVKKKTSNREFGEGNYKATQRFRKSEETFIARNRKKIPKLGKDAEAALEGPEGKDLRAAEAESRARGEGMDIEKE
jgi:hypothetical protein